MGIPPVHSEEVIKKTRTPMAGQQETPDRPSLAAGGAAVFIIACCIFLNNLGGDFLTWDDTWLIKENPHLKGFTGEHLKAVLLDLSPPVRQALGAEYLPVRDLSWMIDHALWGLDAGGYHAVNNLLHAANSVLIFLLLTGLFRKRLPAFAAALLFAVHPVHAEAVSWMSARKDVLFSFFFLLSLLAFLRWLRGGPGRFAWLSSSLLLFILSLFSKAAAVTLPLVLMLILVVLSRDRKDYLWTLPYFIIALMTTVLFYRVASYRVLTGGSEDLAVRLMTSVKVLGSYLLDLLWPLHLSALYHVSPVTSLLDPPFLLSLITCGLLAGLSLARYRRCRVYIFGCAWFIILLLPVLNLFPISILKADRYVYLSSAGFFAAVAYLLLAVFQAKGSPPARTGTAGFIICVLVMLVPLSLITWQRNRVFQNDLALWENAAALSPDHPKVRFNLARQYEKLAEKDPAYREALVEAYRKAYALDPDYLEARYNLAVHLHEAGAFDEAFRELSGMLRRWPADAPSLSLSEWDPAARVTRQDVLNQLGVLRMQMGDYEGSLPLFREALAGDPENAGLLNNYAYALLRLGAYDEAASLLEQSLEADPSLGETYFLAGQMHLSRAAYGQAETRFLEALEREPRHIGACNNLGLIYLQVEKDYARAISYFKKSLSYQPDQPRSREIMSMIEIAEGYLAEDSN
jgi:tetratricopeptide (TPR) repeat protein